MKKISYILSLLFLGLSHLMMAQSIKLSENFKLKVLKEIEKTETKNQYRSGTCWSFSGLSFFESELIRMGKGKHDLSEMFVVRKAYEGKMERYVRMHGHTKLGAGGAFHDVTWTIKHAGVMPNAAYPGIPFGDKPVHGEMDAVLKGMGDALILNKNGELSPVWKNALSGVLDAYLGPISETFSYDGKTFSPIQFRDYLGLNMEDYVEISSFTHHPFYESFVLEVPDNWMWDRVYNVPLDEMMDIMYNSLDKGFGIAWASDISETGFSYKSGLAILPSENALTSLTSKSDVFNEPLEQATVNQEERQKAFDNYQTQDDHGMHITGYAESKLGDKYFIVKNSWGETNTCDGYIYASDSFVRLKTTCILVHKEAISKSLRKKLKID